MPKRYEDHYCDYDSEEENFYEQDMNCNSDSEEEYEMHPVKFEMIKPIKKSFLHPKSELKTDDFELNKKLNWKTTMNKPIEVINFLDIQAEEEDKKKLKEQSILESTKDLPTKQEKGYVEKRKPRLLSVSNQNDKQKFENRMDLLCIFSKGHNPECRFSHSLEEWQPKICRFQKICNKFHTCSFWHSEIEDKQKYLNRICEIPNSYFQKNNKNFHQLYIETGLFKNP